MTDHHKHSKMVRKKVRHKRNLKVRLKNKLNFSLGKEKVIYIIIGIILAVLVAKALIWYIQKTEEDASLKMNQYAAVFSSNNIKSINIFLPPASLDKSGQPLDGIFISAADLAPDILHALRAEVKVCLPVRFDTLRPWA